MPHGSTQYPEICNQSVDQLENGSLWDNNSEVPKPPLYLVVLLSLLFALIFVFGVAGNLLVTCVVLCGKTLRTSVNYFVISLCAADLLVIIFCMPTAWVDVYAQDVWYFGEAVCKYFSTCLCFIIVTSPTCDCLCLINHAMATCLLTRCITVSY